MGMRQASVLNINGSAHHELSGLQKSLLNDFQNNFPLSPTPYADIAAHLGVTEKEVLDALRELDEAKIISRIGPVFRPHCIGTSTLVAMAVPKGRLQHVANYISALPEVNHNYEREHSFNLWFVVTATTEEHLQAVLTEIEENTGIAVMSLPMLESYHIDLGFDLNRD
jgi:DNA-binding Lrp family transcriptional regulator